MQKVTTSGRDVFLRLKTNVGSAWFFGDSCIATDQIMMSERKAILTCTVKELIQRQLPYGSTVNEMFCLKKYCPLMHFDWVTSFAGDSQNLKRK